MSGLVLKRDIYYTQDPSQTPTTGSPGVHELRSTATASEFGRVVKMFDFLADPEKFAALKDLDLARAVYTIQPDHFMMMGDNSPQEQRQPRLGHPRHLWRGPRSDLF